MGVLIVRALLFGSVLGSLIFGNSHVQIKGLSFNGFWAFIEHTFGIRAGVCVQALKVR